MCLWSICSLRIAGRNTEQGWLFLWFQCHIQIWSLFIFTKHRFLLWAKKKKIKFVSSSTFCMTTDQFPWMKKGSKVLELSKKEFRCVNWKDHLPGLHKVWIWEEWDLTLVLEVGWRLLVVPEHAVCVAQIDLFLRSNIAWNVKHFIGDSVFHTHLLSSALIPTERWKKEAEE